MQPLFQTVYPDNVYQVLRVEVHGTPFSIRMTHLLLRAIYRDFEAFKSEDPMALDEQLAF